MTAPATVNLVALERAIAKVLCDYGLGDHDSVQVNARPIEQGGYIAGVTIDAFAFTRPAELPPVESAPAETAEAAEDLEAVS